MKISQICIIAGVLIAATLANAQTIRSSDVEAEGELVEESAQLGRGQVDVDPNITNISVLNDRNIRLEAPPNKKATKSQERPQIYKIDNRTPWFVKIYKNGNFYGLLPPWGNLYTYSQSSKTISGKEKLYAVAHFKDGLRRTWGPKTFPVNLSQVWRLNPAE